MLCSHCQIYIICSISTSIQEWKILGNASSMQTGVKITDDLHRNLSFCSIIYFWLNILITWIKRQQSSYTGYVNVIRWMNFGGYRTEGKNTTTSISLKQIMRLEHCRIKITISPNIQRPMAKRAMKFQRLVCVERQNCDTYIILNGRILECLPTENVLQNNPAHCQFPLEFRE